MNKQLTELIEWMEGQRKNLDDPMYSGYILNMTYKRIIEKAKSLQSLTNPEIYTKADLVSKEDALGFAEWVDDNYGGNFLKEQSTWDTNFSIQYTTEELFTFYQQTK